ncbi:MAG: molybdopterin-dependent oxidoreductase [Deltaproteobacteria bacterium]|nr:molybdopterin-dependent oxidoreductase [Deltaproteobacteria bacterium]
MASISRRAFLQLGAGGALALSLRRLTWAESLAAAAAPAPTYRGWEDVYRAQWRWDKIACGTHTSANCIAACAWNLYVRDGIVWREEQSAPYAASNATVPDWNPRGCQKGASCADLLLGPTRLRYPIKRVGPRGSGQWQRITWDEALGEIAGVLVDTLVRRGGGGAVCELGGNFDFGCTLASTLRFFRQIGVPITDPTAHTGDLSVGAVITIGAGFTGGSSDDWFRSKYIVCWSFNPAVTRIPDAHFLSEARYRGAQVVTIAPDYNQTAIHGDLWISPHVGTDAALALSACQVILEENRHNPDYIREQTDLPLLVRDDTRRYLRESDVVKGGSDSVFAVWDEAARRLVWAPGSMGSSQRTIALPGGMRPALEMRGDVQLASGERVAVRTVFSLLRERLQTFRPEAAERITGVSAEVIRRFARDFAQAPAALIIIGYGINKHYHGDLNQRAQLLMASLTGNIGKPGSGWHSGGWIDLEGLGLVGGRDRLGMLPLIWLGARAYMSPEEVKAEFLSGYISSTLFHTVHAGLGEYRLAREHGDPSLPRPAQAYLDEALAQGHFPIGVPPGGASPEVIISICGNVLRHSRMGQRVRETLFASARLVVDIGFRMSETARYADIVLPAAGWYEKMGLKYVVGLVPYITLADRATAPAGESKPEWEIYSLLAQQVAAEAKKRGVSETMSFRGQPCDLAALGERYSDDGRFGPKDEEGVLEYILSMSGASKGIALDDLRRAGGAIRVKSLGPDSPTSNFFCDYRPDEPIAPLRDFVEKRRPYPTLTGRQQFYIDHPWFLELGEELPTFKQPPAAGGDHPFFLTSGHTRWSIHSMWRDHPMMLRLQRGEPVVFLNEREARERGIADHDRVRVWNDLNEFVARAVLTGTIHPGQVHLYHAWEPFQYAGQKSHQFLIPSPIKPTQLVGDYGHLRWSFAFYEPNAVDRDTRVNIAKA